MSLDEQAAYHDAFDVQTLSYRAPEVIYGQPFGHAIDAWSLGVILAELFGGKVLVQAAIVRTLKRAGELSCIIQV